MHATIYWLTAMSLITTVCIQHKSCASLSKGHTGMHILCGSMPSRWSNRSRGVSLTLLIGHDLIMIMIMMIMIWSWSWSLHYSSTANKSNKCKDWTENRPHSDAALFNINSPRPTRPRSWTQSNVLLACDMNCGKNYYTNKPCLLLLRYCSN